MPRVSLAKQTARRALAFHRRWTATSRAAQPCLYARTAGHRQPGAHQSGSGCDELRAGHESG